MSKYTIKPSGETFVTRKDGVDYFCIVPPSHGLPEFPETIETHWRRLDEVVINDTIAKMRPKVIIGVPSEGNRYCNLCSLYGVINDAYIFYNSKTDGVGCHGVAFMIRLATIDDL